MTFKLADRVKETTTTAGTSNVVLGGAYDGYRTFATAIGNAHKTYYVIVDQSNNNWEVGVGTYHSAGNILSRDTVLESSNSNDKISLTGGVSDVFVSYPAEKVVCLNPDAYISGVAFSGYAFPDGSTQTSAAVEISDASNLPNSIAIWSDASALTKDAGFQFITDKFVNNHPTEMNVLSGIPLTITRYTSGNFFEAYIDNTNDRTLSLYLSDESSPTWKLGLKNDPSNNLPPEYGYTYGSNGSVGQNATSDTYTTINYSNGIWFTHKSSNLFNFDKTNGGIVYNATASAPAFTVKGAAAQSANLQEWKNISDTVVAYLEPDGSISGNALRVSGVMFPDGTTLATAAGLEESSTPIYDDVYIKDYIYHNGDTNTYIKFTGDEIKFAAGGRTMLTLEEASNDKVIVNDGGNDVNFRIKGQTDDDLFFTDAGNDRVGIGTDIPDYLLDVSGVGRFVDGIRFGDGSTQATAPLTVASGTAIRSEIGGNTGSITVNRDNIVASGTAIINSYTDLVIASGTAERADTVASGTSIIGQFSSKANLNSPAFAGTPTAPTAAALTNTTQIATTAFVRTEVTNLVDSAPGALDTLNELAAAINDDASFSTTVTNSIATKASLTTLAGASGALQKDIDLVYASGDAVSGIAFGAYAWGNHASVGYGTPTDLGLLYASGSDTSGIAFAAYARGDHRELGLVTHATFGSQGLIKRGSTSGTYTFITDNSSNWNTAYGWGDHGSEGYLTAETFALNSGTAERSATIQSGQAILDLGIVRHNDFDAHGFMKRGATSGVYTIVTDNSANWNTAYGWGDHGSAGYLTAATFINGSGTSERAATIASGTKFRKDIDLVFASGSDTSGIAFGAYAWGNHGSAGYLTTATFINGSGTAERAATIASGTAIRSEIKTYTATSGLELHGATAFAVGISGDNLLATNDPVDNYVPSFNLSNRQFTWVENTGGGGGGSMSNFIITDGSTPQTIDDGETVTFADGTGAEFVTSATNTVTVNSVDSEIVHDNLSGFVANEHIDWTASSAGTIHASNYTDTNTQLSEEEVEDFVGGMLGGTETGITVTYQDSTHDIDFVVADTTVAGDTGSTGMTPGDTLTIAGGTNVTTVMSGDTLTVTATDTNTQLTQEQVEDFVGGMLDGDETFITVTYDDTDGNIDFTVPVKDEDDMTSNSATHLATQQSIKAYVDTEITDLIGGAPGALDTLNELAAAINDDASYASTITTALGLKAPIASPTFTGTVAIPNIADLESAVTANTDKVTNATHTGDVTGSTALTIAAGAVDIAMLSATGTASSSTFLRGDNAWVTPTDTNTQLSTEEVQDIVGGMLGGTETLITVTYQDGTGDIDFVVDNDLSNYDNSSSGFITATLTNEQVQDIVGAMVASNTETGITVTYEDGDGTLDFVVGTLNQDTSGNAATATALETARTIAGVSFDGTANISLNNNAITNGAGYIAATLTNEQVQDIAGAMFSSNTETRITATYQDADGTVDLVVDNDLSNYDNSSSGFLTAHPSISAASSSDNSGRTYIQDITVDSNGHVTGIATATETVTDTNTQLSTEEVQDIAGGMFTSNTETRITATYQDADGTIDLVVDNDLSNYDNSSSGFITATLTTEQVQDIVGGMVTGNTETGIAVTYEDGDGTLDFVIATLNQDTTGNADTATALATGRTIGMTGDVVWTSASFTGAGNVTGTSTIQALAVETGMIAADAITGAKIADDTIDSEHYAAGSIDNEHLADDAVGTAEIADDAITSALIADDAIVSAAIADDAVLTAHIADDQITAALMADNSIDSDMYVDGSIDTAHIGDLQVTTGKIAADAITGAKIADDAIDSEHYAAGSIDTAHIADDQVTYAKIQNVTATNVVLGRDSAGAGIVEEISAADLRTMINVEDGAAADQTKSDIDGLAITTVGAIDTGTWQATDVAVAHGGTGASSAADARSNLGITYANIGTVDISANTNLAAGTNITLSGDTLNVDDAFLKNNADDTTSGTVTMANLIVGDAGNIGSASDTGAIAIASDGEVTLSQRTTFSKAVKTPLKSNTDASTVTFNLDEASTHTVTLGANRTLAISNEDAGQKFIINLVQDGTGSRTVTWFSTIKWAGGSAPTLTTTANKADSFGFLCTGTDAYYGFVIGQNI